MSVVLWLAVISYMLRVSLSSIDIPDVEPMNSPLCNNLVKALALQKVKGEVCCSTGQPRLPPPTHTPSNSLLLSDNLLPTSPTPSQLICHLHSSLQDNSNEPKETTSKVWNDFFCFLSMSDKKQQILDQIFFFFLFCTGGFIYRSLINIDSKHAVVQNEWTLGGAGSCVWQQTWRQT